MSVKKPISFLDHYQSWVDNGTFAHITEREAIANAAMGLSGEAGEVTDTIKKMLFHPNVDQFSTLAHIEEELGDVMWYVANVCNVLGFSIDEVIEKNQEKLIGRYPEIYGK